MENRIDLIAGVVLCLIGVLGVAVFVPFGIQEPQSVDFAALSPSFWPRFVCIALGVMGAIIAVAAYLNRDKADESDEREVSPFSLPTIILRVALALAFMFASYFLLEPLGFVITGALVLLVFMIYAGERNALVILPVAVGVPLFLFFFFTWVANIPIPNGVLAPVMGGE
ncbi:MAG: tripartite tricarboxylate transporter TctB family protein [Methyloligellaceae bacterium]